MILVYLKQAWRSLSKNKIYSFLNIVGLSAGLTCFAFIAAWVNDELSYDKFNKNYNRIFRLTDMEKTASGISETAVSSAPMALALKNDYPEIEQTVRLKMREEIVEYKGGKILQSNILVTDPSFFEVFSYRLTHGNMRTALSKPFSIILTKSTAKKYFGESDPMGKTLLLYLYDSTGRGVNYTVTGLMPDPPKNAHFVFTMLASFKTIETVNPNVLTTDGWGDARFYTYLLLKKGVDYHTLSNKITQFYKKYIGDLYKIWGQTYFYKLQPISDIHLRSHLQYEIAPTGDINNVYIFSTIGIFILLLAGINYINLSTARAISRAKEVSIKKVVGAARSQLIIQYISEAVLTNLVACVLALLLCIALQPLFSQITSKEISPASSPLLLVFLGGITIILGFLSGIYPAFVISAFKPINVLKGSFISGSQGSLIRKSLVTTQFIITFVLITGILIIRSQLSYIQDKDLGYKKEGLIFLAVNGNTDVRNGYESFKNELSENPLISGASTSNAMIVSGLGSGVSETVDITGNPLQVNTARLRVDPNYLNVYGIKLIAGRNFDALSVTDTIRQIILNQSAIKKFGWKGALSAIGKPFSIGGQKGTVIGIVKDFNFNSLHEEIQPLAIFPLREKTFSRITIRADVSNPARAVDLISSTWKKHYPSALLDYSFLDKELQKQYQEEQRFSKIFSYFSLLSLLIGCLGLYGLISYAASQRIKEIGIRKVLGASVQGITVLLTSDFLKLITLAFLIASPIAWYIMQSWLQNFAYRIDISWWMFLSAGILVTIIALATVSFQAIKAATANPVKSLRTE